MPNRQTERCPFKSRFAPDLWISAGQYLAESMCDRQARRQGVHLPHRFWEADRWKRSFLFQLREANGLLKTYALEAIVAALRTPEGQRVLSFSARWLDPIIREQERRILRRAEEPPPPRPEAVAPSGEPPRPAFVHKPSALSRLRGL